MLQLSSGPTPTGLHVFCAEDSRAGRSTQNDVSQEQREGQSPPSTTLLFDAAHDAFGFLGCKAHIAIELFTDQ